MEELIFNVFSTENGKTLLKVLHDNIWAETPRNVNNTNEHLIIAGKRMLIRDIEIIMDRKQKGN